MIVGRRETQRFFEFSSLSLLGISVHSVTCCHSQSCQILKYSIALERIVAHKVTSRGVSWTTQGDSKLGVTQIIQYFRPHSGNTKTVLHANIISRICTGFSRNSHVFTWTWLLFFYKHSNRDAIHSEISDYLLLRVLFNWNLFIHSQRTDVSSMIHDLVTVNLFWSTISSHTYNMYGFIVTSLSSSFGYTFCNPLS